MNSVSIEGIAGGSALCFFRRFVLCVEIAICRLYNWPISAHPNTPNVGWVSMAGAKGRGEKEVDQSRGFRSLRKMASAGAKYLIRPTIEASAVALILKSKFWISDGWFRAESTRSLASAAIHWTSVFPHTEIRAPVSMLPLHQPHPPPCDPVYGVDPWAWLCDRAVILGRISQHGLTHGAHRSFCPLYALPSDSERFR